MTKPVIVKRATKGSALTYEELDQNFQNLADATVGVSGDSGTTTNDLNGSFTIAGGTALTTSVSGSTSNGSGGGSGITDLVQDTSPQLGGDLDVNGHSIVSVSNGNISIVPNGSGNILLTPATGHVTISSTNFPTGTGTTGQYLKTDGAGNASWSTVTAAMGGQLTSALDLNGYNIISGTQPILGASSLSGNTYLYRKTFAYKNLDLGETGTPAVLGTNGTSQTLTIQSATTITLQSGSNGNIILSPNGTGVVSVGSTISSTTAAGVAFLDRSGSATSYANGATVDFANFSGLIMANRQDTSGNVSLWIVGSTGVVNLANSTGSAVSGSIAYNSGISGYRWTNDTGGTITVAFAAVKTRAGA
jgi:hypothetical protein